MLKMAKLEFENHKKTIFLLVAWLVSICFQKLFGKHMAEQLVHERYPPFGDGWAGVNGFLDNLGLICCDESSGSKQGICLFFFLSKKS